ncbi:MAG: PorP/SprF family type IX secretion system membrane protein [Bacteroidetes bacterium]|nr:PorP/SprF family type IX secretion system membrane protein [Bacteroidales bacterium]NJO69530.1 PorP/SprF family type IX secretion system membrane protein [Bacteroidota bacterium]
MKNCLFILFLLIQGIHLKGQEQPVSRKYLHNLSYINPACVGQNYCTDFFVTDRHQWLGIDQAPATQVLGVEHAILPNPYKASRKFGLSLEFISDNNGAVRQTGGQAGYAFHTRLNKKKDIFMSLGLKFSMMQHSIQANEANVTDPILGAGESALLADASTGIYFYSPKFYAGFSMMGLLPSTKQFYENKTTSFLPGNFYLFAGYYIIPKTVNVKFNPSFVIKMNQKLYRQIDFNLIADFGTQFQAGMSYRQNIDRFPGMNTELQFLAGTRVKIFHVTYVFGLNLNSTGGGHWGSHELGLNYRICYREKPQCPALE